MNYTKNLAYVRDALKNGPARHVIEGLAQEAESYKEAIGFLQRPYDQQYLIHQAHICVIYKDPFLRNGNDQELHVHCLHGAAAPHIRALKAMDYELSGPFVTAILDLKLNLTTVYHV